MQIDGRGAVSIVLTTVLAMNLASFYEEVAIRLESYLAAI